MFRLLLLLVLISVPLSSSYADQPYTLIQAPADNQVPVYIPPYASSHALQSAAPAASKVPTSTFKQPDLISISGGYFDFDKHRDNVPQAADMRLEYRWGISLLPHILDSFKTVDPYMQIHPFVGVEGTDLGLLYGLGGLAMDGYIGRHVIFTWSEGVGFLESGADFRMGSFVEFRSQVELGWRFTNEMRLTGQLSHISNDKITYRNPGSEIAGMYLHIPVKSLF